MLSVGLRLNHMGIEHLHKHQHGQWLGISVALALMLLPDSLQAQLSGLHYERDLNYAQAVLQYREEIEQSEQTNGEFAFVLFEPLMGLARSLQKIGDYEAAAEAARRAQHITHRHHGVHSPLQLEAVKLLTQLHLRASEPLEADKQQRFAYYIRKSNFAADSLEQLPAMEELANWFEKTGQLYRARKMNEQSLEIVEAHFGEDAIEQLPYLERLAKLKRLQRVCCSTHIMKQALDIVEANPNVDDELKVRTFLEIGDAYTISGNREEAETFYRRAWDLMPAAERIDKFSAPSKIAFSKPLSTAQTSLNTRMYRVERDPFGRRDFKPMLDDEIRELESLPPQEFVLNADNTEYDIRIRDRMLSADPLQKPAVRTVGQPYTFLRKQFLQILPSRLHSDQALEALEVDLEFDIDATGKPFNIKVISEGTPSKVNRLMRDVVRKSRFRPRMEDGYPVATRAFKLTQSFAAKTTITSESI